MFGSPSGCGAALVWQPLGLRAAHSLWRLRGRFNRLTFLSAPYGPSGRHSLWYAAANSSAAADRAPCLSNLHYEALWCLVLSHGSIVHLKIDGHVASVTLDDPDRRIALGIPMFDALAE